MTNKQRRDFLRISTVLLASGALPACGGGAGAKSGESTDVRSPVSSNPPVTSGPPVIGGPPVTSGPPVTGDPTPAEPTIPRGVPAWLAGQPLNKAFVIPNSAGTGGVPTQAMKAWSGYAVRLDTNEVFSVLNGGHGDGYDNRVTSINLSADAPAWVVRNAPTPFNQLIANADYNADGKPVSRHNYDHAHWVPQINRILLVGGRGTYNAGGDTFTTNGFNPDTNAWDPAGTWPFTSIHNFGVAVDHVHGHVWTQTLTRYNPQTKTYDRSVAGAGIKQVRYPTVYDSTRDQMFCLMWGDGGPNGVSSVLSSSRFPTSGVGHYEVTFNASAAFTQFQSEWAAGTYAGMTYDSIKDQFYWYSGQAGTENHLYIIKPNNGNVWDMSLFSFAPGSASLPPAPPAGLNGRIKYLPGLKGFIVCPTGYSDMYFVRTS